MIMIKHALGCAGAFLATVVAQAGQASPPDITIRATTRLVEITVVAQGKHGVPVRDLLRENFKVFDEGKPQRISFFSLTTHGGAVAVGESPVAGWPATSDAPVFSNRSEALAGPGATTVILIDPFNTGWADRIYAKQAVIAFLRQIRPEDRVGIDLVRPGYLQVLYDLTRDSSELVKRLAAWKPDAEGTASHTGAISGSELMQEVMSDLVHGNSAAGNDAGLQRLAGTARPQHRSAPDTRGQITLRLFAAIANRVAAIPGRKNLIWVSSGFPISAESGDYDKMLDTMRVLNSANVALYAVDARGLVTLQADATVRPPSDRRTGARTIDPLWLQKVGRTDNRVLERTQGPMLEMSALTGGRAFLNTNDIQGAIRTAAEEASVTYTLGFYPASPQHDGRFHRVEVKVAGRPDVSVRYRKGYVDAPDPANDPQGRTAAIRDAAWSPLDATAVALSAEVVPANRTDRYDVRLRIDPRTLDIQQERDLFNGRVDVVLVQEDHEGGQYDQVLDTLVLALRPDTYRQALADGLAYSHALQPNPKANELRVIVRDAFSGNIGSLTIPFKAFRSQQ
jgi:VWFA-related protein